MRKYVKYNKLFYISIIALLLMIGGCSALSNSSEEAVDETENPDAAEILEADPEADIFQFEGVIYQANIDWVDALSLTKGEQVGEIRKRNDTDTKFEDEMSNKLPVGAKIFSVKDDEEIGGPTLIVESAGKLINYYGLVEG